VRRRWVPFFGIVQQQPSESGAPRKNKRQMTVLGSIGEKCRGIHSPELVSQEAGTGLDPCILCHWDRIGEAASKQPPPICFFVKDILYYLTI
jgi:hypothetical protein